MRSAFLGFIERDLAARPQRIVSSSMVADADELARNVTVSGDEVISLTAECDRRLATLNSSGARERFDAAMAARGWTIPRPKAGESF
jgi:hypothetical protein